MLCLLLYWYQEGASDRDSYLFLWPTPVEYE